MRAVLMLIATFVGAFTLVALFGGCSSVCTDPCNDAPAAAPAQEYDNPQILTLSVPIPLPDLPDIPTPCQVLRDVTDFLCPCECPPALAPAAPRAPQPCPPTYAPAAAPEPCQPVYTSSCEWSDNARGFFAPVGDLLQPINDLACAATTATHSALGVK